MASLSHACMMQEIKLIKTQNSNRHKSLCALRCAQFPDHAQINFLHSSFMVVSHFGDDKMREIFSIGM